MEKTIEALKEILETNPKNANAWIELGQAYYHNGKIDKAIDAYNQALNINPNDDINWQNLGYLLGHQD